MAQRNLQPLPLPIEKWNQIAATFKLPPQQKRIVELILCNCRSVTAQSASSVPIHRKMNPKTRKQRMLAACSALVLAAMIPQARADLYLTDGQTYSFGPLVSSENIFIANATTVSFFGDVTSSGRIETGTADSGDNLVDVSGTFNNSGTLTVSGTGITSSAAANDSMHLTALGVILNTVNGGSPLYTMLDGAPIAVNDVLVKYTYYGDADLGGGVDGSDYSRIDNGYLEHLTGWENGDFNYDGVVNGSDYTLIDNAFNQQGAPLSASIAAPSASATAYIAQASTVPEPASLCVIGLGCAGLLSRRHRVVLSAGDDCV